MSIFTAAMILKQLHMLKASECVSYDKLETLIKTNFRINRPSDQSQVDFIKQFCTDYNAGRWTKYLAGREERRRFYLSSEWLSLKKRAIRLYGNKCMACGTTKDTSVDHVLSRYTNPELELDINNLQILCLSCNINKSSDSTDYRKSSKEK
jgi:hypothetical protein